MATSVESMPSGSHINDLTESQQNDKNSAPPEAPYKLENKKDNQINQDNKDEKKKDQNEEGKGKNDTHQKAKIFDNKTFVEAPIPKTNPWTKPVPSKPAPVSPPVTQNQGLYGSPWLCNIAVKIV